MDRGMKTPPPAPDFPECSTCTTTSIASHSRSMRWHAALLPRKLTKDARYALSPPSDRHDDALHCEQAPSPGEEVPARDDARAAARVQSDVHRMRSNPRVPLHHHAKADRGAVPLGRGRVRRPDRLDLRRRTDDLPGAAAAPARVACARSA